MKKRLTFTTECLVTAYFLHEHTVSKKINYNKNLNYKLNLFEIKNNKLLELLNILNKFKKNNQNQLRNQH